MGYVKTAKALGKLVVVGCLLTYGGPHPRAGALCGTVIEADVKLDQDLPCTGDGLIAGADRIKIDLNGHALSGAGTGAGIVVTGRTDVTIAGGTITGFATAIRVNTSTDMVIRQIEFAGNSEGIDFQAGSVGNTVKDNRFSNSAIRGIMLRTGAIDNDIKNNTFTGNRVGILIFAGVDNSVKDNVVSGSSLAGIRVNTPATGNILEANTVLANAAGIEFLVTPTGSAVGNELKDNTISANTCGLKGPTAGNELKANLLEANVADTCS